MSTEATFGAPISEGCPISDIVGGVEGLTTAGSGFSAPVMCMMGYGLEQRALEVNPQLAVAPQQTIEQAREFFNDFRPKDPGFSQG